MLRKWYIELACLLGAIIISVYFAFKIDFTLPRHFVFDNKEDNPVPFYCGTAAFAHYPPGKREQWTEGKSLFKSNCASCHNPKADGTGPALQGVTDRWNGAGKYKKKTPEQWLKVWIKNWHQAVESGYPYAVAMANTRSSEMNVFTSLTDEQIDDILLYVNNP